MLGFLTRKSISRTLILNYRGIALSSLKNNDKTGTVSASQNTVNVQPSRKTALYDFHLNNYGRM